MANFDLSKLSRVMNMIPLSAPLVREELTRIVWTYSYVGGAVVTRSMELKPDGTISGFRSANIASWDLDGDILILRREDGEVCARLSRASEFSSTFEGAVLSHPEKRLRLAADSVISKPSSKFSTQYYLEADIARYGWSIGDYTYGSPRVLEAEWAKLIIGRFTSIGPEVMIILGDHDYRSATTYPFLGLATSGSLGWEAVPDSAHNHTSKGDIIIGNDVWIGARSTITSGVTIGDGAVIAAGSIVTRDVPPYQIYGGNPARFIKHRHPPEVASRLLATAWWDWPIERIQANMPFILSTNVSSFIEVAFHIEEKSGN
jgi:hypothetical protein